MNIDVKPSAVDGKSWSHLEPGRNGELEVLRTIAILMVLLQHLPMNLMFWPTPVTEPMVNLGTWCGVDLFFAVSGFVIARSLIPQLQGVRDVRRFAHITVTFWIRRAWRLWPSAWLWLALPLVLCLTFNNSHAYGSFVANWCMAMAGIANVANFYLIYHYGQPGGVGTAFAQWSLSLEEQFYFALPFAIFVFRRYLPALMGFLLFLAFYLVPFVFANNTRSGAIAAGVLLAIASRHRLYADCAPVFLNGSRLARICVVFGGVALLVSFGDWDWRIVSFIHGPIAIISGLMVWVASYNAGFLWRPGRSRQVMEIVAARTYSIYLVHIPVYAGMHEAWYRMDKTHPPAGLQIAAYFAIAALLIALFAELNHRLLERPLREHGKRVAQRYALRMREASV